MKIPKLILLFVVAFSATMTVSAQSLKDISAKMNDGGKMYTDKNFTQAIPLFKSVIEMAGKSTEDGVEAIEKQAKTYLAECYRLNGIRLAQGRKYDVAIPEFKNAIKAYDKVSDISGKRKAETLLSACYSNMANDKFKANDFEAAAQICMTGIAVNKTDTKLMLLAANCREKENKDEEAIAMYQQVMSVAARSPRYKVDGEKAKLMLVNGQLSAASKLADKGQTQVAIAKIDNALKYVPKEPKAKLMKIQIYSKAKDYRSVVKFGSAAAAVQATPAEKSSVYFMIGAAFVALGDNANAVENYKKVTTGVNVKIAQEQIEAINKNKAAIEANASK